MFFVYIFLYFLVFDILWWYEVFNSDEEISDKINKSIEKKSSLPQNGFKAVNIATRATSKDGVVNKTMHVHQGGKKKSRCSNKITIGRNKSRRNR